MNRKIFDSTILLISAVGAVFAIVDPIINYFTQEGRFASLLEETGREDLLSVVLKAIFVAIIIAFVVLQKRKFANLFSVLCAMANNNKVNPLRSLVMIEQSKLKKKGNKFHVNHGVFTYKVSLASSKNGENRYDVRYSLGFDLSKPRLMRMTNRNRMFHFYLIGKTLPGMANMEVTLKIGGAQQEISAVIKNPTTCGESHDFTKSIATLYEVQIVLPQNITRRDTVELQFSYDVKDNLIPGAESLQVFFIAPRNYGKKMKLMTVMIDTPDNVIFYPEIQRVGPDGTWGTIEILTPNKINDHHVHYRKTIKPDMNAVYFIQCDLVDKLQHPSEKKGEND